MLRKINIMIIIFSIFMGTFTVSKASAETIPSNPNYTNPPYHEINKLLTETAIEYNIPPEIVKTVAYKESGWNQFVNGEPNISKDNGIGIMQITNDSRFDLEKLKTDIEYNIEAGVRKLDEKFRGLDGKLPILNNNDRTILESWYFAILAYNGQVERNSPILKSTDNSRNSSAYQEEVYELLQNSFYIGIKMNPIPFNFKPEDFTYSGAPSNRLIFNNDQYQIPKHLLNKTSHNYEQNEIVLSGDSANFREAPTSMSKSIKDLPSGQREAVRILEDSFAYDKSYNYGVPDHKMPFRQFVWYKVELEDGRTAYTASSDLKPFGKRLYGKTRYDTAVAISQEGWKDGSDTVVLANGTDFPDALAGTPLAYQLDAPMLLTGANSLAQSTRDEISRLKAKKVILLGGTGVISEKIEDDLKENMNLKVLRYGGKTRFDTAAEIARHLPNKGDKVVLAYGRDFPDALAIAPYAARNGYPILLTETSSTPVATQTALEGYKSTLVVGGTGVISNNVFKQLNQPKRFSGKTRYETNADIVKKLKLGNEQAYIATGGNFADALTGAVLAAKRNAPLLLTWPRSVQAPIKSTILEQKFSNFAFLGGKSVVGVENEIKDIKETIEY